MVSCCVNPACRTEYRPLHSGDLYALERPHQDTELFWVCSTCASRFNLCLDSTGSVSLRLRAYGGPASLPNHDVSLRLAGHSARRMPWRRSVPASVRPAIQLVDSRGPAQEARHNSFL